MSNTSTVTHGTQSCSQLESRLQHLQTLFNHVFDPDAQAEIAVQIGEVVDQMNRQGCFARTDRTLTGTASVCTDPPYVKRTDNIPFTAHLHFLASSGTVGWEFDPIPVGSVTVTQQFTGGGADITGFFDSASGELELGTPINVDTPFGSGSTQLSLFTNVTILSPCLGRITGAPVSDPSNMAGSVTLVGSAALSIAFASATVYLQVTGTLSA